MNHEPKFFSTATTSTRRPAGKRKKASPVLTTAMTAAVVEDNGGMRVIIRKTVQREELSRPETAVAPAPMTQPVIAREHAGKIRRTEEQRRYLPETGRNERVTVGGKSGRPSRRPTARSIVRQAHAS